MLSSFTTFLAMDSINCILEPVQNVGGLYLGNIYAAFDDTTLAEYNIGAILTVAAHTELSYKDKNHLIISVEDIETENLAKYFDQMIEFIEQNLTTTNVLVHCFAGVSRSASAVIVYLMHKHNWDYNRAYIFVKNKRPIIYPNTGFQRQLRTYEKNHKSKTVSKVTTCDQVKVQPRSFSNVGKNLDAATSLKNRLYNIGSSLTSKKLTNNAIEGVAIQNQNQILPSINLKKTQNQHPQKQDTAQQIRQITNNKLIFNNVTNSESKVNNVINLTVNPIRSNELENHKEEYNNHDKKSKKKIPQIRFLNQKLSDLQLDGKNLKINQKDTMKVMYKNLKKY